MRGCTRVADDLSKREHASGIAVGVSGKHGRRLRQGRQGAQLVVGFPQEVADDVRGDEPRAAGHHDPRARHARDPNVHGMLREIGGVPELVRAAGTARRADRDAALHALPRRGQDLEHRAAAAVLRGRGRRGARGGAGPAARARAALDAVGGRELGLTAGPRRPAARARARPGQRPVRGRARADAGAAASRRGGSSRGGSRPSRSTRPRTPCSGWPSR